MATYKFWKKSGGAVVQQAGGTLESIPAGTARISVNPTSKLIVILAQSFEARLDLDADAVEIEDVAATGDAETIGGRLRDEVFLKAGGSASTTLPVLSAPDDSQWVLGVNNAGALVTSALESKVGASALSLRILEAPDGGQWVVGVNSSGALVTSVLENGVGATALASITLTAPDNTVWTVSVTDTGALQTTAI